MKQRRQAASDRRIQQPNLFYTDVAKPRAIPVHTVVTKQLAHVTEVNHDGTSVRYAPMHFQCDQPVDSDQGLVFVAQHDPGHLVLHQPANLEPGDPLYQATNIGNRDAVFAAFIDLWKPMWTRHQDADPTHWDPFVNKLMGLPGASEVMPLQPITITQWERAVGHKKARTATGPDGVSRLDLLHMPPPLTAQLIDLVNQYDQCTRPWPQAALVGHISNVEKCPDATAPQQFRPITVLTLPYRV